MALDRIETKRMRFLNTYIDNVTAKEAKGIIDGLVKLNGTHYVVTPNSDIVVKMQEDERLKYICENADLILTDGQIMVKISRFLKKPIKERVCMTDFVWDVLDLCKARGYSVGFLGGQGTVLNEAVKKIQKKYPGLKIADHYSPPMGFEKDEILLEAINERLRRCNADILIVFLGCPKQEKFIFDNKDRYQIPVSITMGGCVDFIAGSVKRAPLWMQQAGLEWFYRFLQEPRRLFQRYFIDDIKIFKLAWDIRRVK